ncbi:MAG: hypothetical protein ACRYG8_49515, partial [Janthinobacterium lividum]
ISVRESHLSDRDEADEDQEKCFRAQRARRGQLPHFGWVDAEDSHCLKTALRLISAVQIPQ